MSKKKSSENFESKLARLEEITESLENNDLGLEQSLSLFEEGVALSKECSSILEKAELKVKVLKKDLDTINISNQDSEIE
ncbi:MAG: exodeoxyribonuclease VII small subunit [Ignavibacteriaceae bacterium]